MANEAAAATFRKSYPIDFSLLDHDDQPVMYISADKDDWDLYLTVTNTSSQDINLTDKQGDASSANHHFALQFTPGTLSKRTLDLLSKGPTVIQSDWQLGKVTPPAPNADVSLYLRYTGVKKVLAKQESYTIKLSGISAAPGSGARGTQVELMPNQMQFAGEATALRNGRTQYIHVTNHSGRKNIPLHVAFVHGNRILNSSLPQTFALRITNVFKDQDATKSGDIPFRGSGERLTKLVLSYDAGDTDWSLAKTDAAQNARVTAGKAVGKATGQLSPTPEWEITFESYQPEGFSLASGKSLDIEIAGLVVSPLPGPANLYVRYYNVPGYWDGQFVCPIEKGPMVLKDGKVGIGRDDLLATLDVFPDARLGVGGNRYLWFGEDTHRKPATNDLGGLHVAGNCSELKISAGYAPDQKTAPIPQLSLFADNLAITGKTSMDFGPGGGIEFLGNNNGNPGIMAQRATEGLTICGDGGKPLPKLMLEANEVIVTGTMTLGEDIWKDVVTYGSSNEKRWMPFTRVASRKDINGVVHLHGAVFGGDFVKDSYMVRLDRSHWETDKFTYQNDDSFVAKGITSSWNIVICHLWLVGHIYGENENGWIKLQQALDKDIRIVIIEKTFKPVPYVK